MKINKDLSEALLMLSTIILVLVGTSDFSDGTSKNITMICLGVFAIVMLVFRIIAARQKEEKEIL